MTARTKTARKPARKQPRQARSQATVNAVLEATVQVLEREGVDAATTTRIAEVAGVSIGTLYQYFSHRDAILDALQDREFERALVLMQSVLSDGNLARSPGETVKAVVKGLAELYAACPGLHRLLAIEGLRVTKAERVYAFDLRVVGIIRHFLAALTSNGTPIRRQNVDAAAFVAFQSVRATMLASLLERPPGLGEAELIEEIADLVLRYLVDVPEAASRSSLKELTPRRAVR
jgi:AcrR family transcriptional regulator